MTDQELEGMFDDHISDRNFFLSLTGLELAAIRSGLEVLMSMPDAPKDLYDACRSVVVKMDEVVRAEAGIRPITE